MAEPNLADELREIARRLQAAEDALRHDVQPMREAVHRELVQAASSVGRALHLIGEGP